MFSAKAAGEKLEKDARKASVLCHYRQLLTQFTSSFVVPLSISTEVIFENEYVCIPDYSLCNFN